MRILSLIVLALLAHPLQGQTVFELKFEGEKAVNEVDGSAVEMHDVVVFKSGQSSYADLGGTGGMTAAAEPALNFTKDDPLWLELQINPLQANRDIVLVSKGSGGGNYKLVLSKGGQFAFSYYSQGAWRAVSSETPLDLENWQHIALYFDSPSGRATLLRDGKVVAVAADLPPFQSTDREPLYIGGVPLKNDGGFKGLTGQLGPVVIARGNPRNIPQSASVGQAVYEVKPPN